MIDWRSDEEVLLLNPRLPDELKARVQAFDRPKLSGHIWLASSGSTSTGEIKLYALSKKAFLESARGVNEHLEATKDDLWLNVLPTFHVGGLSIFARGHLSGAKVIDASANPWSAEKFLTLIHKEGITLTSLVPAQVFDLIQSQTACPPSLRAIVVGGARLSKDLYLAARKLGYPVLPSYGMTEACSQVATAELRSLAKVEYPKLKILSHLHVVANSAGKIVVSGKSLYSRRLTLFPDGNVRIDEPAEDGFHSEDLVKIEGGFIEFMGRADEIVKISGELVSLRDLRDEFQAASGSPDFAILTEADERRGLSLLLVLPFGAYRDSESWVLDFNRRVLPVAAIRRVYYVESLPKTAIGKLAINEIRQKLQIFAPEPDSL